MTYTEISEAMKDADAFVLFSNIENLPLVLIESLSTGTPIITTNVGGISEYFPHDFGDLIVKQNETQLLEKIHHMYQNSVVNSKKMHLYAVKHFSEETISNHFSKLYYKSLNNNPE